MTKLYFCNTVYSDPPCDLNPLLLRAHPSAEILVLCAKTQQLSRIGSLIASSPDYTKRVTTFGWWEARDKGLFDSEGAVILKKLYSYDIIVILNQSRIDKSFSSLVQQVISQCNPLLPGHTI